MRKLLAIAIALAAAFLAAPQLARAQATLTMEAPSDKMVDGLRIFDSSSMNPMDITTYDLGIGRSVTLQLGPPRDTGYNLSVLQTLLVPVPSCGKDDQAAACLRGDRGACESLPSQCFPRTWPRSSVTNQGVCNSNISPVNGKIVLSLSCSGSRVCDCSIKVGQRIASQADKACPFTCQSWNSASHSCIGPTMNGC
jgi:hypothetical protein